MKRVAEDTSSLSGIDDFRVVHALIHADSSLVPKWISQPHTRRREVRRNSCDPQSACFCTRNVCERTDFLAARLIDTVTQNSPTAPKGINHGNENATFTSTE
jgi:hypothetical protein